MPLPAPRKVSSFKADKLAELIAASSIAPTGSRSEPDFSVCCFAIRNGIAKEEVWAQVEQVGKFAEQGRRYCDLTWDNAEREVRSDSFDKLQKRTTPKGEGVSSPKDNLNRDDAAIPPDDEVDGGRPTIVVDPTTTPVAVTLHQVTDRLLATGNCLLGTHRFEIDCCHRKRVPFQETVVQQAWSQKDLVNRFNSDRRDKAEQLWRHILQANPADRQAVRSLAASLLSADDIEGYQNHCLSLSNQLGEATESEVADSVASCFVLYPWPSTRLVRHLELAQLAVDRSAEPDAWRFAISNR